MSDEPGASIGTPEYKRTLETLEECGLLLRADALLPSVASIVAGEPTRGSWWAHPANHEIYHVSVDLAAHDDVAVMKLISGKDTYVHRSLWPAVAAIGVARERWQLDGLSRLAREALDVVTTRGEVLTKEIPWLGGAKKDSPGEVARQLARRLLVQGHEVHTESGAHAKRLESWQHWAKRVGLKRSSMKPERAKKKLEDLLAALNERFQANGRLRWEGSARNT